MSVIITAGMVSGGWILHYLMTSENPYSVSTHVNWGGANGNHPLLIVDSNISSEICSSSVGRDNHPICIALGLAGTAPPTDDGEIYTRRQGPFTDSTKTAKTSSGEAQRDKLVNAQILAIELGLSDRFQELEQLRRAQPGDHVAHLRTDQAAARLRAQESLLKLKLRVLYTRAERLLYTITIRGICGGKSVPAFESDHEHQNDLELSSERSKIFEGIDKIARLFNVVNSACQHEAALREKMELPIPEPQFTRPELDEFAAGTQELRDPELASELASHERLSNFFDQPELQGRASARAFLSNIFLRDRERRLNGCSSFLRKAKGYMSETDPRLRWLNEHGDRLQQDIKQTQAYQLTSERIVMSQAKRSCPLPKVWLTAWDEQQIRKHAEREPDQFIKERYLSILQSSNRFSDRTVS